MSAEVEHEMLPEGESTAKWAAQEPGFLSSIKRLTCCARCGDSMPIKRMDEPVHFRMMPVLHCLCDPCHDALPD
jgi:hypothetical protein